MGVGLWIMLGTFLFISLGIILYIVGIYNGLISLKENIKKSWSNIDVILKQRHDELPKLIAVCEGYAEFEKGVLDRIMQARENYFRANTVGKKAEASFDITAGLKSLFALAETFPNLKADQHFTKLQDRIVHLEESIADRREFYNDSVNNYNIRIKQIPDVFVAGFLRYQDEEMFKVSEEDRQDVDVKIKIPKF